MAALLNSRLTSSSLPASLRLHGFQLTTSDAITSQHASRSAVRGPGPLGRPGLRSHSTCSMAGLALLALQLRA
eukprot:4191816-Lingulodinium_polyedra.AAC.1